MSRIMWEDRVETAFLAVKEAVIPLLAEKEVLEKEVKKNRLYKYGFWGAVGVAVVTTIIAIVK